MQHLVEHMTRSSINSFSICQFSTQFQNGTNSDSKHAELCSLDIKTEDLHVPLDYGSYTNQFVPCYGSLGTPNNAPKLMQRSYSSNSFENKPNLLFQPGFDSLMESPNYLQNQLVASPQSSSFSSNQIRRVCSTGDLHYACRKTLADTLSRIRGRFARNDVPGDLPNTTMFNEYRFQDDEVFRVDGLHEEEYGSMMMAKTPIINKFSATQEYQYFSYPR